MCPCTRRRELYKLLYGGSSIYARTPSASGVASISPADLAAHIAKWERPDAALLGLVGDFDADEMLSTVQQVGARGDRQGRCTCSCCVQLTACL